MKVLSFLHLDSKNPIDCQDDQLYLETIYHFIYATTEANKNCIFAIKTYFVETDLTFKMKITESARKFIEKKGLTDVTFSLVEHDIRGAMGIIKEIIHVYKAPVDASGHKFFQVENLYVFVDRNIEITGPLILKTEGLLKNRLALGGAKPPFFNF